MATHDRAALYADAAREAARLADGRFGAQHRDEADPFDVLPDPAATSALPVAAPDPYVPSAPYRRFEFLDEIEAAGYVTDEFNRWQQGLCPVYALALVAEHPHLRIGVLAETDNGGGDASDGWREVHTFAHDDEYAYDSLGRHPLPYRGIEGNCDYQLLDQDPEEYGYLDEWPLDDLGCEPLYRDARRHAWAWSIVSRPPIPPGGLTADSLPPQPGGSADAWRTRFTPTGRVAYEREFSVNGGQASMSVSPAMPGEEPKFDGRARVLGSGAITIASDRDDSLPGEMHYQVLDAPLLDADGNETGQTTEAIYVNWVEVRGGRTGGKGKGWASAMYAAVRDAHPHAIIPAAANLEPPGKRLVKHYRDKHPDRHTGRFDSDCRIHPTTGSEDRLYRTEMLTGPSWKD